MFISFAGVAQLVEQLICNQQVGGSSPSTSSIFTFLYGRVPEWPKGADCKSVASLLRWSESTLAHQTKTPVKGLEFCYVRRVASGGTSRNMPGHVCSDRPSRNVLTHRVIPPKWEGKGGSPSPTKIPQLGVSWGIFYFSKDKLGRGVPQITGIRSVIAGKRIEYPHCSTSQNG